MYSYDWLTHVYGTIRIAKTHIASAANSHIHSDFDERVLKVNAELYVYN